MLKIAKLTALKIAVYGNKSGYKNHQIYKHTLAIG